MLCTAAVQPYPQSLEVHMQSWGQACLGDIRQTQDASNAHVPQP